MEPKDKDKKKTPAKKKGEVKVSMIQASSLKEALEKIGAEIQKEMGKKKMTPAERDKIQKTERAKLTPAETAELNKSWDEYAIGIREKLKAGKLDPSEACMIGISIDNTAEAAKTEYITKSMLELGIELVEFLDSVPAPEDADIPAEILKAKSQSARNVAAEYRKRIGEIEAPAKAEAEAKEKAHVAAEAQGMFANVTMADILNAPKAEGLPDF